jgi:peptide/nickel transport system permease protein
MTELWHRFFALHRARVGLVLVALLGGLAILAPVLASYDPSVQLDLANRQLLPPSIAHPFGTDFFSRDMVARVLHGARISLSVALLSVALSVTVGAALGLISGALGGVLDTILMRLVDAALAVPRVFLLLLVLALWHDVGLVGLIMVIGLTSWFDVARIVRAEVMSLKAREFIVATRALGFGMPRVAFRHLLPNVAAPIIVTATLGIGQIVLLEAGLSYLGIGVQPPTPSWGTMIADGQALLTRAWWIATFPGIAIVLTVIGFSLVGDGLRDAIDPQTR